MVLKMLCVQPSPACGLPGPNLLHILKYLFLVKLNYSFIHGSPFIVFTSVFWIRKGCCAACICLSVYPPLSVSLSFYFLPASLSHMHIHTDMVTHSQVCRPPINICSMSLLEEIKCQAKTDFSAIKNYYIRNEGA